MPGCEPRIQSTTTQRGGGSSTVNLDHLIGSGGQISITDELFRDLLTQHKKRKAEEPVCYLRKFIAVQTLSLNVLIYLYFFFVGSS